LEKVGWPKSALSRWWSKFWPYIAQSKLCLLSGAQRFSHTEIKGSFIQNGQDVPITSQISKENFEMIKKLQKRRISLWYVLVLRLKGFTNLKRLLLAAELGCLGQFRTDRTKE